MSRDDLEAHAKALRTILLIADALLAATDPSEVPARAIDAIARFTHFPGVAIFDFDESAGELVLIGARGFGEGSLQAARRLPLADSLTGISVSRRELVTSEDVGHDPRTCPPVREELAREGFTGIASMPLLAGDRVLGALNLIYKGAVGLTPHERELIASIAKVLATSLERLRYLRQLRREQQWRSFLDEASVVLGSSLDYEATLTRVARCAVVVLADWCIVDIVQPDGVIRRVAGVHADPAKQPLVDALVRAARIDPEARVGVSLAVRTGRTVFRNDLRDSDLLPESPAVAATRDAEHLRLLREIGMSAFVCVPLLARGKVLGAMCFGSDDPRRFGQGDVARAEELAQRCALAIENARLYREACDAVIAREEFLRVASHELRTPVQALRFTLEALGRKEPPQLAPTLARATKQVDRLNAVNESLLTASRIATGEFVPRREDLDLGGLVERVVRRCTEDARRAGSELRVAAAPVHVLGDAGRLEQAIASLVANALKYGAGKPVEVSVDSVGALARVTVTDHGIGIAPEDLGRIFDRFERAVSVRHYGGLGLGLYIARGIAEAHGGKIAVASEPGAGSSFVLSLPLG
jgi:signal transduction histidine kinase